MESKTQQKKKELIIMVDINGVTYEEVTCDIRNSCGDCAFGFGYTCAIPKEAPSCLDVERRQ